MSSQDIGDDQNSTGRGATEDTANSDPKSESVAEDDVVGHGRAGDPKIESGGEDDVEGHRMRRY